MVGLLRQGGRSEPSVNAGYVDVLGDRDAVGPHRGQQVFRKKILTLIYERFWRPVVSHFFLGFRGPNAAEEKRLTIDMLEVSPGDRAIDIGCGPGNYTADLAAASGSGLVVGLDASEAMVAAAARRGGRANLAYLRGDACALPFEDGTFDAACSVGVIHLLEEPMRALEEIVRVLAPGGRLAIVATCARGGTAGRARGGLTLFGRDELPDALRGHGLLDIDQRVIRRGQFIFARKPEGDRVGH
jgi:SAM-dependent methyltransferase